MVILGAGFDEGLVFTTVNVIGQFESSGQDRIEVFRTIDGSEVSFIELAENLVTFGEETDDNLLGYELILDDGTLFVSNDVLIGQGGNDILDGNRGSDTYVYEAFFGGNLGGNLIVRDLAEAFLDFDPGNDFDVLRIDLDQDVPISYVADWVTGNIVVEIDGVESITLEGQLNDSLDGVESVEITFIDFSDFSSISIETIDTLSREELIDNAIARGTSGDDVITVGNDIYSGNIESRSGDDTLIGLGFDDRAIFDGNIGNNDLIGIEEVEFTTLLPEDVRVRADGNDLVIFIDDENSLRLVDGNDASANIMITFADGDIWDIDILLSNVTIDGSDFNDTLIGGLNDDVIIGFAGDDLINGQTGNDVIAGSEGSDTLIGGQGDDSFVAFSLDGSDDISGGDGFDTYDAGQVFDNIQADLANGTIQIGTDVDNIDSIESVIGGAGNDDLTGSANNETLIGGRGNDLIFGLGGDDLLEGSEGADIINGGEGNDTATYEQSLTAISIDLVSGSGFGGQADGDVLTNIENIIGSNFSDNILGDADNNVLIGGRGNDIVAGGLGDDEIVGGIGNDQLFGGAGNDLLQGGAGIDELFGGDGNDTLDGGSSLNFLSGGEGDDTYFVSADGQTFINDLAQSTNDRILLDDFSLNDLSFVRANEDLRVFDNGQLVTEIVGQFGDNTIEAFEFSDGVELSAQDIENLSVDAPQRAAFAFDDFISDVQSGDGLVIETSQLFANDINPDNDEIILENIVAVTGGTVSLDANGNIIFNAEQGFTGVAEFEYSITDGSGDVTTASVFVEVVEANPDSVLAVDDSLEPGLQGEAIRINVDALLENDVGEDLSVISVFGPNGEQLPIVGGIVEFSSSQNTSGILQFSYVISDASGETSTAIVSIDVTTSNNAPVEGTVLTDQSSPEEEAVSFALPDDAFTDVDGDDLSLSATLADGSALPSWLSFDGVSFTGTPPQDFNGDLDILVTASDGALTASQSFTLSITAVNDAPVAEDDAGFEAIQGEAVTIDFDALLVNDSDQDGDNLSIIAVSAIVGGTVQIIGTQVEFTPEDDFVGIASFEYTLTDNSGETSVATVQISFAEADTGNSDTPSAGDDEISGTDNSDIIDGLAGDDLIYGLGGSDQIIGGLGSDVINGGAGNDILTGDTANGSNDRFDQDVFVFGDVENSSIGNDVLTDFDTDNFRGGENNFDTLSFTFGGVAHELSTGEDIVDFVDFIESDGDTSTDAIRDGSDIILVFQRDENGFITDSIRLEDVIGDDGITTSRLNNASIDTLSENDLFVTSATSGNDNLNGTSDDDVLSGLGGDDVVVGGLGSDIIDGGTGDDILTGDAANGSNDRFDQDIFVFGDVENSSIGNDVITDFDTDNFRGGENNFDTLSFTFGGVTHELSTGEDFVDFVEFIESDGDTSTDAIRDGDDLIFVFQRNEDGEITDSIRLEDIIGDDGITTNRLNNASIDTLSDDDVFATSDALATALQKTGIQSPAPDAELDFDDYFDAEIENSVLDALA